MVHVVGVRWVQIEELTTLLDSRAEVTSLMLRNTSLDDWSLERIAASLCHNTRLQYLNLNCNNITPHGIPHVFSLIQNSPQLESLA